MNFTAGTIQKDIGYLSTGVSLFSPRINTHFNKNAEHLDCAGGAMNFRMRLYVTDCP